jgi:hypothetical protein
MSLCAAAATIVIQRAPFDPYAAAQEQQDPNFSLTPDSGYSLLESGLTRHGGPSRGAACADAPSRAAKP